MPETTPVTEMVIESDVHRRLESVAMTLETCGEHGIPIDFAMLASDIRAALSTRTPEAAQVDILREALEGAEGAIQAAFGQAEAEYRDHDRRASQYDATIRAWREKRDTALAQVRHPLEKEG